MSPLVVYFLAATFVSSIGMLFILLVKKGLKKHISVRWQYKMNSLFFVLLAIPFIPDGFFSSLTTSLNLGNLLWLNILRFEGGQMVNTPTAVGGIGLTDGVGWLQDFAVPITPTTPEYPLLILIIIGVWFAGIIAFTSVILRGNKNLRLIKESVKLIEDKEVLSLFFHCKALVGVKGNMMLGTSVLVKVPMTVGFFKTFIVLPAEKISLNDTRYALLHELTHCKNKDIQINSLMCLFQILYWFNPVVYLVFKQMRLDRELACDTAILEMLPNAYHVLYGATLLNFVSAISRPSELFLTAGMGGSEPQIIKRIKHITSYTTESGLLKVKSVCIFVVMGIFIFCQIPIISAFASSDDSRFHFQADNVLYKDLSYFFDGFEGSFVLYDLESSLYTIHNREMSEMRVSPLSTYKIFSALIALETGYLDASNTVQQWDGTPQPFEAWNQNHNLASAMQSSVNWYFQYFDAQVGLETLRSYLALLHYGNRNLSGGLTDFWIESSLRISPVEQVKLLRNVYLNDTIFEGDHIDTVKDALRLTANLSGKTGTGIINGRAANGWFIGYIENEGSSFIFATYIQGDDNAGGSMAAQITLSILADKGIYYAN